MLKYGIIGSGYRAEFYGRIARNYPGLFKAVYLCRSPEKAERMTARTGAKAVLRAEEIEDGQPDFVVIAVDKGHIADETMNWAGRGFPVVAETPVGNTVEKMTQLWKMQEKHGARIVCCEQYFRYPILMAGLQAIREGTIGTASSIYVSLLHHYHAASLIRKALGIGLEERTIMRGSRSASPMVATDSRECAILDGTVSEAVRDRIHIDFESGKQADYDFAPAQYRTYLRSRHLIVRGDRGEWSDTLIRHLDETGAPAQKLLLPEIPARYRGLDTQILRDCRRRWQSDLAPDTIQDEFAMASILLDMGEYLSGGPSPYPLEEALWDACFWLQMEEAVAHPWQETVSMSMPWSSRTRFKDRG